MSYETIEYLTNENIATIALNRPHVMNAISPKMEEEISRTLYEADKDDRIRVIVITGRGRAFCSGYDMSSDANVAPQLPDTFDSRTYISQWSLRNNHEMDYLREIMGLTKPVIAAVNGYCLGGGFWYSLSCDITIASDDAIFGQPEVRGTSSTSFLLTALAGWKVANRYAYTGDHFDAEEALRIGVINEIVPANSLLDRAYELAARIALVPEPSTRMAKAVSMSGLMVGGLENSLRLNQYLNTLVHSSWGPEEAELRSLAKSGGLRAFLTKRDGPFKPEPAAKKP